MNELRMRRGAAVCMAITSLLVPTLMLAYYDQVVVLVEVWWLPVSISLVGGSATALLLDASFGNGRRVGPLSLLLGVANAAAVVLWLVAWKGGAAPSTYGSPPIWPANTVVLPAVVMATVYRPRVTVTYTAFVLILLATAQQYVKQGQLGTIGYANSLLTATLVGVFLTVEYSMMRALRETDARRDRILAASANAASRAARTAERERLDAVVRDGVVAMLRLVSENPADAETRREAATALADLDGRSALYRPPLHVSARESVLRLREAVNAIGDDTMIDLRVDDPEIEYPHVLVESLVDAAAEAVANAVTHAGPGSSRALVGVFDAHLIRLRIVDDGVGFDPDRVPPDRAGIELGILRRMREQPGGGAWIDSSASDGTMVSLEWRRP
ncbi:ATP-binding protein [Gordonia sihwensis]|uniref:ATP-binding protein n=1 Tax=Gordonia sihwensis TaxID=173559 RepID=UPI003D9937EC